MGSPAWFEQHDWLESLNLQAHLNAQAHSDEFVKEALVARRGGRVDVLVQELVVAEVRGAHPLWQMVVVAEGGMENMEYKAALAEPA